MAFDDPLQWIMIGAFLVVVIVLIGYVLLRFMRTLDKADKYFDSKSKGNGPPGNSTESSIPYVN
jgi:hypothetical protein